MTLGAFNAPQLGSWPGAFAASGGGRVVPVSALAQSDSFAPVQETGYQLISPFARLVFTTSAGFLTVSTVNTWTGGGGGEYGVAIGAGAPTIADTMAATDTRTFTLGTPGTPKTITITGGPHSLGTPEIGAFPVVLSVPAPYRIAAVPVTPPTRRIVVYGDSITVGLYATELITQGWAMLVRADYPGQLSMDAYAGRSLFRDNAVDGIPALCAVLASMADATVTNEIYLAIGTNDWGFDGYPVRSVFTTRYTALLTGIRALTAAKVWAQSPIPRTDKAVNAYGDTLAQYRTCISDAVTAAAISDCTYVDGTTWAVALNPDGIHPTTAGHASLKALVKTAVGY